MNKNTSPYRLDIAILFIIFNRVDVTKKTLEAIRTERPTRIYIAGDGARKNKNREHEKVQEIREYVLSNIDWDCEVKTLFREHNFGCGLNVKLSIDWFFENEEMGIILEDDCLPTKSFFLYCNELLNLYKNDNRIGMIAGTNHIGRDTFIQSYTFSKFKACWGWATWKRSWENMDFDMSWLNSDMKTRNNIILNMGSGKYSEKHWTNVIELINDKVVDAWDWQWYFSIASQGQLCIFPKYNLVANIGFGQDATHTAGKAPDEVIMTYELSFPLDKPKYVLNNIAYDKLFEKNKIKPIFWNWRSFIPKYMKKKLKNLIYGSK